jgi:Flp pilus assembly protein TadG
VRREEVGRSSRRRRHQRRRHRREDEGYSIVETTIALPFLILATMLVVQWALVWHGRHIAEAAAQDALRAARGYQATSADGRQAGERFLDAVAPRLLTSHRVDVTRTETTVTVHVHARVLSILTVGAPAVEETASGPVERFVP